MMYVMISRHDGIEEIAAEIMVDYWSRCTGQRLQVVTEDPGAGGLIVLGSDARNGFVHEKIMDGTLQPFRLALGTDAYQMVSREVDGRHFLFLAGARPRALLYAVYRFFEMRGQCRYFWDGDVIPQQASLDITGLDLLEKPRFQYRGLRYFAHRSLDRFQAEHWNLEEWKREIDWMVKKRLNLFMLRIGLDDMFQRAFPETVHETQGYDVPEAIPRSYDDRTLFWDMDYRSQLRKGVLDYAKERDLIHPEDVGTMTHWYSRTPYEYLDAVKPDFVPQATSSYGERTGLVWDIRQDRRLDDYWKLTEAHIRDYGSPTIFHTIGLAERNCYADRKKNQQMKLYAYRRIIAKLREHYPNAPLMVGTWDFAVGWHPEEVCALVEELDPSNVLLFDYTSDTTDELNNVTNWGVLHHFPWLFGIFHAYESNTEIRGNYDQIKRRLDMATEDPMCKGFLLWPECSHSDSLMLEFMTENAWCPEQTDIEAFVPVFCRRRYAEHEEAMEALWKQVLPLARLVGWPGPQDYMRSAVTYSELMFRLLAYPFTSDLMPEYLQHFDYYRTLLETAVASVPDILRGIKELVVVPMNDFMRRDIVDLARTTVNRLQTYCLSMLILSMEDWRNGCCSEKRVMQLLEQLTHTVDGLASIVDAHEDYSLYDSLIKLQKKHETNPKFDYTLKGNAENLYCRSYISELFSAIYKPELAVYADWIVNKMKREDRSLWRRPLDFDDHERAIQEAYYETPLQDLAPDHASAWQRLPDALNSLDNTARQIIRLGRHR